MIIFFLLIKNSHQNIKVEYTKMNALVLDYLGVNMKFPHVNMKDDVLKIHNVFQSYKPNAIGFFCNNSIKVSGKTRVAIIIKIGASLSFKDIQFKEEFFLMNVIVDKNSLVVVVLKARKKVSPHLIEVGTKGQTFSFLKIATGLRLVANRNYFQLYFYAKFVLGVKDMSEKLHDLNYTQYGVHCRQEHAGYLLWVFENQRNFFNKEFYFEITDGDIILASKKYLFGHYDVFWKKNFLTMVFENAAVTFKNKKDCEVLEFSTCDLFQLQVNLVYVDRQCVYEVLVEAVVQKVYPCELAVRVNRFGGNFSFMLPYDFEEAYKKKGFMKINASPRVVSHIIVLVNMVCCLFLI